MKINNKFELGQAVFLITDTDQRVRMVTCIKISLTGILYYLACGTEETQHYENEIAEDKKYF